MEVTNKKLNKLKSVDNKIENIKRTLVKKGEFEKHEDSYNNKKKEIKEKIASAENDLDKMKNSKLYTGDENVIATKPNGSKVEKNMHIGGTLYYGKTRAKEIAQERDDIKKHGFAMHDATYDELRKKKIETRKKQDIRKGLNQ